MSISQSYNHILKNSKNIVPSFRIYALWAKWHNKVFFNSIQYFRKQRWATKPRSQNDGQTLTSDWTEIDKFRCNMPRYKVCKDFS